MTDEARRSPGDAEPTDLSERARSILREAELARGAQRSGIASGEAPRAGVGEPSRQRDSSGTLGAAGGGTVAARSADAPLEQLAALIDEIIERTTVARHQLSELDAALEELSGAGAPPPSRSSAAYTEPDHSPSIPRAQDATAEPTSVSGEPAIDRDKPPPGPAERVPVPSPRPQTARSLFAGDPSTEPQPVGGNSERVQGSTLPSRPRDAAQTTPSAEQPPTLARPAATLAAEPRPTAAPPAATQAPPTTATPPAAPQPAAQPSAAHKTPSVAPTESTRLLAIEMAVTGSTRNEVATQLREHGIADPSPILDDIFGLDSGESTRVPWGAV